MKINKPIVLYIPSLIIQELDNYLEANPLDFKYHKEYFYYIIYHLTNLYLKNKDKEYVSLNKKHLAKVTSSNIDRYITILKKAGLIITDNKYVKGSKSYGYTFNPEYLSKSKIIIVETNTNLFKNIINMKNTSKSHDNRLESFLKQMKKRFMEIELDYDEAENWILKETDFENMHFNLTALQNIKDKRFRYFKRNKTNKRLDSNFTNLKKEIRQFIKGDLISIDLINSQFFLHSQMIKGIINVTKEPLCSFISSENLYKTFTRKSIQDILLIHQNVKNDHLVNLTSFEKSVTAGVFYEDFEFSSNGLSRDEIKTLLFKVLFSRNSMASKHGAFTPFKAEKEIFASIYPFVSDVIYVLKKNDHAKLAIFLQSLESFIFIDNIAKNLVDKNIIPLTIHDSVIVERKYQDEALEIVKDVFLENFGVIPEFHVKSLKDYN